MPKPILIVEDDPLQQHMLATLIQRKMGFESLFASHGRGAIETLAADSNTEIKLVILDLNMPVMGGIEALKLMKQSHPLLPVIMLTGSPDIEDAVTAMKLGATDFITKPFESHRMIVTLTNAMKIGSLSKELVRLKKENEHHFTFMDLIGHDTGLRQEVINGRKAAATDIPILITGATGVGKEIFAKAVHGESLRAGKPFIAVNCGAIPAQLIESTLFGHEKGAFTGATDKTLGKFREAEGGTIFLDEVGELPLEAQVKLLRVLQEREVQPVGGGKSLPVNIRIISATNRDLAQEIKIGHFREDLFFRLNVLQIKLPSLAERKADIPALSKYFIDRFCAHHAYPQIELSPQALDYLMQHHWPGNIRELENAVSRAIALREENILNADDFKEALKPHHGDTNPAQKQTDINGGFFTDQGTIKPLDRIEREAIHAAMHLHQDNITQAAKALGMAKSTFYRKLSEIEKKTIQY